ncbi:MAG: SAM-dependent methyltransferase [Acidimicrobiia bacterium]|nr:class I SAM-dependent methyltransferase [bacterium]MXW57675.1 SAM-dependent methyltransferase [Acidimicrobiia bacterium]MXZ77991.1 SAM-dependent methyltransferase [Acidimicrobiia bacterium]MYB73706.1 SAM-dependent methyltransferase [Acidimicrobiia bacterium]MYE72937.1 SAM-dependent methyltransferase [Acidimicrobiia bacterium]
MNPKSIGLSVNVQEYLVAHGAGIDPIAQELIDITADLGRISGMQVAPEQAAFMTMLTRLLDVQFAVEVGTFTGFSALSIARGLAPGGRLLCCDVSDEWVNLGRPFWERAGVADRIEVVIAPAVETLASLPDDPPIDLAFIDADKRSYQTYYEEIVRRLSPKGVILVDNVLWGGRVADPDADLEENPDTANIREFNASVVADPRTAQVMLPIADGLTLITLAP